MTTTHVPTRHSEVASVTPTLTVVDDANPNGWAFSDDQPSPTVPMPNAFVAGPGQTPLGHGSASLVVNGASQGHIIATTAFAGTPLARLTRMDYSSYSTASPQAPAMQFDVSFDGTSHYQGRLVFEPYRNGTEVADTWQHWTGLNGVWWASRGASTGGLCVQATPCSWADIVTRWPNATILYGVDFKAGSGWATPPTISTNVDAFTIGIDDGAGHATEQTFDFEDPPPVVVHKDPPPPDYTAVGPVRLLDTRPGLSPAALLTVPKHTIGGDSVLRTRLIDIAGFVPATGVGAVSLNMTATDPVADGYLTVFPCGTHAEVSSVNFASGETVAGAVIATVSADGDVCFASSVPADVVVDLNGWFATGQAFTGVGPARVFDTRPGQSPSSVRAVPKQQVGDLPLQVQLTDLGGIVPATGVGAVSLNVTATNSVADGYITVYPCGARGLVSSVNFAAGQTVANAVIATPSAAGDVCFASSTPVDIVVDVNGWLRSDASFTGVGPVRLFDTRAATSPDALRTVPARPIGGDAMLRVHVADLPGFVPAGGIAAVSLNVTATDAVAAGYVTVYACGDRREVSSVNFAAGRTAANAVIAPVSADGDVCLSASVDVNLVADLNGWFAAAPG